MRVMRLTSRGDRPGQDQGGLCGSQNQRDSFILSTYFGQSQVKLRAYLDLGVKFQLADRNCQVLPGSQKLDGHFLQEPCEDSSSD